MQRYFASVINNQIYLTEGDVLHVTKVMRNKIGDQLIAIDNNHVYLGDIVSIKPLVVKVNKELHEPNVELSKEVTLLFTLAKGDKIDFVIQKATELGVKRIVLVKSSRCIVKLSNEDFKKKLTRYNLIAKEASEQSRRHIIPEICGVEDIKSINKEYLSDINYLAYEVESGPIARLQLERANNITIFIGPEGGFSKDEVALLNKQGFINLSLGKRILRTETAAVAALAMLVYEIER